MGIPMPKGFKGFQKCKMHHFWKGNFAKYSSKHSWIRKEFGNAYRCENKDCRSKDQKIFDWANISGKYLRKIKDFKMLCRSCHIKLDRSKKCLNGHLRTEKNTYFYANGHRRCRTCQNIVQNKLRRLNGRYKGVFVCKRNSIKAV